MPGFRRLSDGATSAAGLDPFLGIGRREDVPRQAVERLRADPCAQIFPAGTGAPEEVPVAFVSDHYCPYCRELRAEIDRMRPSAGITLSVHHWPVFGAASDRAARAALAARAQGAGEAMDSRLMATRFRPTPGHLSELAEELGISAARLVRDMEGPAVERALARSRALARVFGLPGTPALVVGRTLVVGEIAPRRLAALIELERGTSPLCG